MKQWLGVHICGFGHCPPQNNIRRNKNKNAHCVVFTSGVSGTHWIWLLFQDPCLCTRQDFIIFAEFSEVMGPIPLLTIPLHVEEGTGIEINNFIMRIMSVDYHANSRWVTNHKICSICVVCIKLTFRCWLLCLLGQVECRSLEICGLLTINSCLFLLLPQWVCVLWRCTGIADVHNVWSPCIRALLDSSWPFGEGICATTLSCLCHCWSV